MSLTITGYDHPLMAQLFKPMQTQNVSEGPRQVAPTLVGAWKGVFKTEQETMLLQLVFEADQSYRARMVTGMSNDFEGSAQEMLFKGTWRIKGNQVELKEETDGSVEMYPYELRGEQLTFSGLTPDGKAFTMDRVVVKPKVTETTNTNGQVIVDGPITPIQPPTSKVANTSNPVVGTWYAHGGQNGVEVSVKIVNLPNGDFESEIVATTPEGQQAQKNRGNWSIEGNQLKFANQNSIEQIPFALQGPNLILDYRQSFGFVLVLSREMGQGQIVVGTQQDR
jgi:hypothetical protein